MLRQILYILTLVTLNVNPANLCLVLCTQVCTVYSISCILYSGVYSLLAGKVPPPAWPARSCCCSPRYLCSSVSSVRQIISEVRSGLDCCDRNEEELILFTFIHQIFFLNFVFCFREKYKLLYFQFTFILHSWKRREGKKQTFLWTWDIIVSPGWPNRLCHSSYAAPFDSFLTTALVFSPNFLYSSEVTLSR